MKIIYTKSDKKVFTINLSSSKSISNRALILQFLSNKSLKINYLSKSDDTRILIKSLIRISEHKNSKEILTIDVQNAGTAYRFLTSLLAITPGSWILTGSERMRERPIGKLVNALNSLGAEIKYISNIGFPPLLIQGKPLTGSDVCIDANVSSQFISSLLLIASGLPKGLHIRLNGNIVSLPYIQMTLKLLEETGIDTETINNEIIVKKSDFANKEITIEADWSSAGYWYMIVAFSENISVKMMGLKSDSLQGDKILFQIFEHFGVKTEFDKNAAILTKQKNVYKDFTFDFTNYPDIAQTIAVTCAGLGIKAKLTGLESLKIKETDRLVALFNELRKINSKVKIVENSLEIEPSKINTSSIIDSYGDHRMIMSFTPLAILTGSVSFNSINEVSKSYPEFWEEIEKIGIRVE